MKKFIKNIDFLLAFAIGLIPSIITFTLPKNIPYASKWIAVEFILICVLIWTSLRYAIINKEQRIKYKEQQIKSSMPIFQCIDHLCLCKNNNLLSVSSVVPILKKNGSAETLYCFGYVQTINDEGLAQISLFQNPDDEDYYATISSHINGYIVKPTLTSEHLEILQKYI